MISVLLPSRERPELLRRSVESLRSLAAEPVEILVAADEDDLPTILTAAQLGADCEIMSRHGYDGLHLYYRRLAELAAGDWMLVWNDDAVMTTPRWDEVIKALPPQVMVADLQSHHSPMCCFPAVRRTVVRALGRFSSDNPHIDTFWQDAGARLGIIRPVPVHVRHDQQQGPHWMNQHGYYDPPHQAELAACIQKIQDFIREGDG